MFFRGKRYAVSLDELYNLKLMETDIVIIEKQGITEKLRYHANDFGVSLLSTRGFLTENALDLSDLADINGATNVILTDNDISGIVIAANSPYPRIVIDFNTLDYFNIRNKKIREFEEVYKPNEKHLRHIINNRNTKFGYLRDTDFKYLQEKRIEIHAILNEVGEDKFWQWIVEELKRLAPTRNYNRAIKIPPPYSFRSYNAWRIGELYDNRLAGIINPLIKQKKEELTN